MRTIYPLALSHSYGKSSAFISELSANGTFSIGIFNLNGTGHGRGKLSHPECVQQTKSWAFP
jgi:hypothetical protein